MKSNLLLTTTFSLLVASIFPLQAADIRIENDYFIVTLQDTHTWNDIGPQKAGLEEVTTEINNVLDYWSSLFADGHRPFKADDRVTVSFKFQDMRDDEDETKPELRVIGNSSPEIITFTNPDYTGFDYYYPFVLSSGDGVNTFPVNTFSAAEAKLLLGATGAKGGSVDIADITINFNSNFAFYFGETAGLTEYREEENQAVDFNTIFLHEMAHGIGFMSTQFSNVDGTPQGPETILGESIYVDGKLVTHVTLWDALMRVDAESFKPGDQITLAGVDGSVVYNPSTWQSGSSMSHLTEGSDPDAVMNHSIPYGYHYREFSAMELDIYAAMAWNFGYIIPEPSTATLSLIALAGLLARRRRRVAK